MCIRDRFYIFLSLFLSCQDNLTDPVECADYDLFEDECGQCTQCDESCDCDLEECDWNLSKDSCGVCVGDNTSCIGCMSENATNYNSEATIPCDNCCVYSNLFIVYSDENGFEPNLHQTNINVPVYWLNNSNHEITIKTVNTTQPECITDQSSIYNNNECLSVIDATLQFIDLSIVNPNEINSNSFWDFGDGTSVPYIYSLNPSHTFIDTGQYKVSLFLINDGGCIDSSSLNVCVIPESKIYIPNSFSPNNDMCNDFFFVKALGLFYEFNIKIYDRWNTTLIFESNDIILTDDLAENSICDVNNVQPFYKMGEWDGKLSNGKKAPFGAYVYEINYKKLKDSKTKILNGTITLIR